MLRWYEIRAQSPAALDNVMKHVRNGKMMVRRWNGNLFACVSSHHQGWLTKICSEFSATARVLEQAPPHSRTPKKEAYTTPCGEELYDPILYTQHIRDCRKCKKIQKAVKPKEEKVTPRIEPDTDFNLDGVIKSVEATRDRLYAQIEVVDGLLRSLSGYRDTKAQLDKLSAEVKERREAVKLLVSKGNF